MYPPPMMIIDFGPLGKPHHRVRGMETPLSSDRPDLGSTGRLPACDYHLVCSDRLGCPNVQLPRPDKACPPIENGDVVTLLAVGRGRLAAIGIDPTEDPISGSLATGHRGSQDQLRAWSPELSSRQDRPR